MILSSNLGLLGRLAVLFLGITEWALMLLYVYCLKRFRQNYLVKFSAVVLTLACLMTVGIAQRHLYEPGGRPSLDEFDVVVAAESAVSLFILFFGMRKFWRKSTADNSS